MEKNLEIQTLKKITDGLVHSLNYTTAIISLWDKEKKFFEVKSFSTQKIFLKSIKKILKTNINKLIVPANQKINKAIETVMHNKIIVEKDFSKIVSPIFKKSLAKKLQNLEGRKSYILLPLQVKNEFVGFLLIVSPKEVVPKEEIRLLQTFSEVASFAIKNTQILEQTETMMNQLRDSEEKFKLLFDYAPDGIYLSDLKGTFIDGNKSAETIMGCRKDELIGKSFLKLRILPPEQMGHAASLLAKNLLGLPTGPDEFTLHRKDGSKKTVEIKTFPVKLKNNKIALGVARDVTDYKQMMNKVVQSEEKFEHLSEEMSDGITILIDGKNYWVNKAFCEIFGYTKNELIGKEVNLLFFYVERNLISSHQKSQNNNASQMQEFHFETPAKRKDGKRIYIDVFSKVIMFEGKEAIQVLVRDISEKKISEEEKEALQNQILQMQKMEAIGRLAGGIAHDINNLLTVISGFSELLIDTFQNTDPRRDDMLEILKSVKTATMVTQQLLTFSRKQISQQQILNINFIINDMKGILNRIIGEDIEFQTELDPHIRYVKIDRGQIEQVIMNLIINARDAMPKGGKLIIKTENIKISREESKKILDSKKGDYVCISVEDTGMGIHKEDIQYIFDPFFTTKPTGKGTGLGLSVTYGIIKQHEGWISVNSIAEQGTTFKFYLPVIEQKDTHTSKQKELTIDEMKGEEERILVIEDDELVLSFVKKLLVKQRYTIFEARNGKEAESIFEKENGNFDLIFCDMILPETTGMKLVEKFLNLKPNLNILFSSGYMDDKVDNTAINQKKYPFIQKPYTIEKLLTMIKEILKQKGNKIRIPG